MKRVLAVLMLASSLLLAACAETGGSPGATVAPIDGSPSLETPITETSPESSPEASPS